MDDQQRASGGCMCGKIRFSFAGAPKWVLHCHCESCRRATSSPMTTWLAVPDSAYRLDEGTPRFYESSPGARRSFCADCGSPLSFTHSRFPDETHLYVASMDRPAAFEPSRHVFFAERLPWADLHDSLPRFDGKSGRGIMPDSTGPATE